MSRMKDMIIDIEEGVIRVVAEATGYDEDYLWEVYWNKIDKSADWDEALRQIMVWSEKDMSIETMENTLHKVSQETGYDEEFLQGIYYERLDEGEDWQEALRFVSAVSYERDW